MTIQELDQEILSRKEELSDQKKKEAYEFISEFIEDNKAETIVDYAYMNIWEFIKCSIYINCGEKDINKCIDDVDSYKEFFDIIKPDTIDKLLTIILTYHKAGKMDILMEYFRADGFFDEVKKLKQLSDVNGNYAIKMSSIKKKLSERRIDLTQFFESIKKYGDSFVKEIIYYTTYRKINDVLCSGVIAVYADPDNKRQVEQRKIEALTELLKDSFKLDNILSKMREVKEYKEEYERIERNNKKEKTGLDTSRNALDKELNKKQIVLYREIIKGIKSPKMKYLFLKFIREHNEKYQEELLEELNKLKQDSKVSIQALLNDYGINKDSYDYDELPIYTKEELESILKVISKLEITKEEKIRIIKSTTLDKIATVKSYLDREILKEEFVSNNTQILDEDSNELDNLKENIELLKKNYISISIFLESIDILMSDPSFISNNLKVLNDYELLQQLNSTTDFRFLLSEDLEKTIDKYLELGFEEYLESDLDLLNKKELVRIEVLKAIGMPITSREELETILNNKDFFIALDKVEEYIPDETIYVEEPKEVVSLEMLEKYRKSRVYDFNGTKISSQKVSRLLENGYSLYQAIIYNTHLSEGELLGIIKTIDNNKKKELRME